MKKKINPKDQTKEINKALYEFMKRDPNRQAEFQKAHEELRGFCKTHRLPESGAEAAIRDSMSLWAALDGQLMYWDSWFKNLHKIIKSNANFFDYEPEAKQLIWRKLILKDATNILDALIFPNPSQSHLIVVNLDRTKEAIMAEVEGIVTKALTEYQRERCVKKERLKWLPKVDEILEVWDQYRGAGQQPWQKTFRQISRKVGRPVSTIKDQWYQAYEKIYHKAYTPEIKYTTEKKRRDAERLCANCPYGAKCYRGADWHPCNDYLKISGKERGLKLVQYKENIFYDTE